MSEWVIEVGDRDFESAVIERSAQVPIVVDFWAPWCGPCRTLGPLLERLAAECAGQFVLAKVDIDQNPRLAADLRIQSIPMVLGFRDRAVVAEFIGALPEAGVRDFLRRVLPSEAEQLAVEGEHLRTSGMLVEAEAAFERALAIDPHCGAALVGLAHLHAARHEDDAAVALLDRVLPGPARPDADRLTAEIRIRQGGGGDQAALRARLAADPADLDARLLLAQAQAAARDYPGALEQYLDIVRRDRAFRDGAARKAMLDIFELLGPGDELVDRYRSELAKVLFS